MVVDFELLPSGQQQILGRTYAQCYHQAGNVFFFLCVRRGIVRRPWRGATAAASPAARQPHPPRPAGESAVVARLLCEERRLPRAPRCDAWPLANWLLKFCGSLAARASGLPRR